MIIGLSLYALVILWMVWEIKHPQVEKTEMSKKYSVDENGNLVITAKFKTV